MKEHIPATIEREKKELSREQLNIKCDNLNSLNSPSNIGTDTDWKSSAPSSPYIMYNNYYFLQFFQVPISDIRPVLGNDSLISRLIDARFVPFENLSITYKIIKQ